MKKGRRIVYFLILGFFILFYAGVKNISVVFADEISDGEISDIEVPEEAPEEDLELIFPKFELEMIKNDAGYLVTDEEGAYYFDKFLTINFLIEEIKEEVEENQEQEVEDDTKDDEIEGIEEDAEKEIIVKRNGEEIYRGEIKAIEDRLTEEGTYIYTIEDAEGNLSEDVITVVAKHSAAVPEVEIFCTPEMTILEDGGYLNAEQFEEFDIIGNIKDEFGIIKIAYKKGEEESYQTLLEALDNSCFDSYQDSLFIASLKAELENPADGVYIYVFQVTNCLGNVTEKTLRFHLDRTAAEEKIFISYQADGEEGTGILDFLKTSLRKLFGKEKINFDLYVKDVDSGIDVEDLKKQIFLKEQKGKLENLEVISEHEANFEIEGEIYTNYSHIRGTITSHDMENQIGIGHLLDRAGNCLEKIEMEEMIGVTVFYLDSQAPEFFLDYKNEEVILQNNVQKRFYKQDISIPLMLLESYYEKQTDENGEVVTPKVEFLGENQVPVPIWKQSVLTEGMDYNVEAELFFPCVSGEEKEYQFCVTYQDGSGNAMEMRESDKGEIENGSFTSQVLVLDGKAPKLLSCEINADEAMEISFSLDERPEDWEINKQKLKFQIVEKESERIVINLTGEDFIWEDRERLHSASYVFEGEETIASNYFVKISYQDCAKNKLAAGENLTGGVVKQGIYSSEAVFLDCKAPIFHISYNTANRLVYQKDTGKENDKENAYPETGYRAYYSEPVLVSFSIEDDSVKTIYENGKLVGLEDYELKINGSTQNLPQITWMKIGKLYQGTFKLQEENTYCIEMQYMDAAKNKMEAGIVQANQLGAKLLNGVYQSEYLTIDKTAPIIFTSYINSSFQKINPQNVEKTTSRYYFGEEIYLQLTIQDKNLRYEELKEVLKTLEAFDIEKNKITSNSASIFIEGLDGSIIKENEFQIQIPLTNEANYQIPIGCSDLCGNKMLFFTQYVTVDKKPPELELSYEVSPSTYKDIINYKDWGFLFADNKISITANLQDEIAGLYQIHFTIIDENGKESYQMQDFKPALKETCMVVLPLSGDDFKGTIRVEALDWANHQTEKINAYIVESESRHKTTNAIVLNTYTAPSRIIDGENYYNTDIKLNVSFQDSYSGLKNLEYSIGDLSKSIDYAGKAGNSLKNEAKEKITYEYSEDMTLLAASNNQNKLPIQMTFTDNAGHRETFTDFYHIDITVPTVEVVYDLNNPENEKYYASARKATVIIQERNFNSEDVNFLITNTDGVMPLIGEWRHEGEGDESKHYCEILFQEDGDYTFTVEFQDMAGNTAVYDRVDEFTIDQTAPVLTVTYDNDKSNNDYYYSKERTAIIDIEEHNFDASLIEALITAENTRAAVPVLSAWRQQGDHYIANIYFQEDAEYTFDISGRDLAGNSLGEYEGDYFIVDKTPPELEILNVLDKSANNGEVMPKIRYSDVNCDITGVELLLTGYKNGVQNVKQTRSQLGEVVEIQLEDFAHTEEMDDMYVMKVYVQDKAGNRKDAKLLFSVNRFGSVYTFDKATNALLQTYYNRQEQDIMITETNIDSLEFQKITCNCNGNLSVLDIGKDYIIKESGTQESWKQYTYQISRENFTQEGLYILSIYSEDRARNTSDNDSKGKKIEFVIDKTSPSILISGIENEMQYRENNREVTLDIQDNLQLEQVEVVLDNQKTIYTKEELQEKNGRLTLLLNSKNQWQTIQISAMDSAGNQTESEQLRFLITANVLVQFFMNTNLLNGTVVVGVFLGLGAGCWRKFRRRNNG